MFISFIFKYIIISSFIILIMNFIKKYFLNSPG